MKFSEAWLREWANPKIDRLTLVQVLTMAGLEVDDVTPVAGTFTHVVVGKVLDKQRHPDADKLSVCQVDVGHKTPLQIVCGARNVAVGMTVPVAVVGAVLPGDFTIKKATLRGIESQGMICSESELGLAESSEGIMALPADAPVGKDFREYLQLDDVTIDIDLTPNRADCLSIVGLARELGALENCKVLPFEAHPTHKLDEKNVVIAKVEAKEACPRYLTRKIADINPAARSPLWLTEKLRRSGIRAIHPAVDVTNYVMLLLGQPMHAFDATRIKGQLQVRMAKDKETLTLLDGQEIRLSADTLLIADAQGPVALAGIMGGEATSVTAQSTDIILEAAWFAPMAIAGRARRYGLHTDASHRFERGVDSALTELAMEYATQLLLSIAGGRAGPIHHAEAKNFIPKPVNVTLRYDRIKRLLGIAVDGKTVQSILKRLGFRITSDKAGSIMVCVPSHRYDIQLEVDLIEEIARVIGLAEIPAVLPQAYLQENPIDPLQGLAQKMKAMLVGRGYHEAITYSFIDPQFSQPFEQQHKPHRLQNPIASDMAVMRTSLLPGLLQAMAYNLNRQQPRVRLFEQGRCYWSQAKKIVEPEMLAVIACGDALPEQWGKNHRTDFYSVKNDLLALLGHQRCRVAFQPVNDIAWLHPGQSAMVLLDRQPVGIVGRLHPQILTLFGLKQPVFLFEVALEPLSGAAKIQYQPIAKFPSIRRDIAIELVKTIPAQDIVDAIWTAAGPVLQSVNVFDVYQGDKLPKDKKSLALSLILQDFSHTLIEDEVAQVMNTIITELGIQYQAKLRG